MSNTIATKCLEKKTVKIKRIYILRLFVDTFLNTFLRLKASIHLLI